MAEHHDEGRGGQPGDENKLIAERRAKLLALRAHGQAFPNDFRRDALGAAAFRVSVCHNLPTAPP